jgi:hypothetical protein
VNTDSVIFLPISRARARGTRMGDAAGGGSRKRPAQVGTLYHRVKRRALKRFGAVLPYARHDGRIWYLFGCEFDRGWTDFGGTEDAEDGGDLRRTAAREAHEESIGLLGSVEDIYAKCRLECEVTLDSASFSGGNSYLMEIEYDPGLVAAFAAKRGGHDLTRGQKEKTKLVWATLDDIFDGPLNEIEFYDIFLTNFGLRVHMGGAGSMPDGEAAASVHLARCRLPHIFRNSLQSGTGALRRLSLRL